MTFFADHINQVLMAVLVVSGGLLAWPSLRRSNAGLSAGEATQLINRRNAVVLDLRANAEFAAGHLPAARCVAPAELVTRLPQLVKNKKLPLLFVCNDGRQSAKAVKLALENGYAEAHVLQGGVTAWRKAGMPIVQQAQQGSAK